jgi:carbon starvation protein CstA
LWLTRLEAFFDLSNLYNVTIALCLHEKWLSTKGSSSWLTWMLLVPNVMVILVVSWACFPPLRRPDTATGAYRHWLPAVVGTMVMQAVYMINPRLIFELLRLKWAQFQQRRAEHQLKEKEMANRESRALFEAALKGDSARVQELLRQGKADVRYRKPKDVKPQGYADWTPTQVL